MPRVNQHSGDLLETEAAGSKSNNASEQVWMYYSVKRSRHDVHLSYICIYKAFYETREMTQLFCLWKVHGLHHPAENKVNYIKYAHSK